MFYPPAIFTVRSFFAYTNFSAATAFLIGSVSSQPSFWLHPFWAASYPLSFALLFPTDCFSRPLNVDCTPTGSLF
ncbi:hypothetical protein [Hymenobacter sp. IS2118]|uniref:hypothetical protein n=1 Tax=Hymenobacter sp. IS2118 TaxID=1505605 RepID=UPI000555AC32|nr:hypothetical protein [Hymenobacter sp. IS2118]